MAAWMNHKGNLEGEMICNRTQNQESSTGKSTEGLESQEKIKLEEASFHHLLPWRFHKLPGLPASVLNPNNCGSLYLVWNLSLQVVNVASCIFPISERIMALPFLQPCPQVAGVVSRQNYCSRPGVGKQSRGKPKLPTQCSMTNQKVSVARIKRWRLGMDHSAAHTPHYYS